MYRMAAVTFFIDTLAEAQDPAENNKWYHFILTLTQEVVISVSPLKMRKPR
jgi:hypothetical protein